VSAAALTLTHLGSCMQLQPVRPLSEGASRPPGHISSKAPGSKQKAALQLCLHIVAATGTDACMSLMLPQAFEASVAIMQCQAAC
jgi:hypothetical protein